MGAKENPWRTLFLESGAKLKEKVLLQFYILLMKLRIGVLSTRLGLVYL